jgi:tRNA pseudouridine65 synthase
MIEPQTTIASDLPLGRGVRIIKSNKDGLVALDKPVGVMSHPNEHKDRKHSLLDAHYDYDEEAFTWKVGEVEHQAWLINRLDSPTSGVILMALNSDLSRTIKLLFSTHKVNKVYYALVKNAPSVPAGVWNDTLRKDIVRGKKLIKGGQLIPAKTRYQVSKTPTGGFPVALVKLSPLTGRTHQLRVQCKNHRHPVVGDQTYGHFGFNREVHELTGEKRMMLHSGETSLRYAFQGKLCDFHAESLLPEAFANVMSFRPGLNSTQVAPRQSAIRKVAKGPLAGRRFKH